MGRRALDRGARSAAAGPHGSGRGLGFRSGSGWSCSAATPGRPASASACRTPGSSTERRGPVSRPADRHPAPAPRWPSIPSSARSSSSADSGATNDTWIWDGTGWSEVPAPTPPPGRFNAAMAGPAAGSVLALRRLGRPVAHRGHLAPARRPVERRQDGRRATCAQSRGDDPRHEARLLRPVRRPRRRQRLRRRLGALRQPATGSAWRRPARAERVPNNH